MYFFCQILKSGRSTSHALIAALLLTMCGISAAQSPDYDATSAQYQTTYNWQKHASFASPYSGLNSLNSSAEKMYTFSTTAHWGTRIWQGGELYFNPELASGIPFSKNLVGLGGFSNGEITRAAGSTPTPYVQRLFIRQTWNNGGGSEKIESDFNQMAGSVDKNRFVLTAGNFSTLDVFDGNTYAKDPRTQFMNWGNWTYSAFDYSADARGFGWGFAGELYQDAWVLRFGRMTGPKVPNGLLLDFALGKHYGDQVEIEHGHDINGQPGKVRVLAFRNRAVLASFNDATAYLATHPGAGTDAQTIFNVRAGEKTKYGFGVNLEQAISTDTGFFLRAMKTDGRTETVAFTEVDDSFSSGFLFKGNLWGRANDTVGLSMMQNRLSNDRRRYLSAGGISFFIGDGALSYKPETIFEGFYSLGVTKNIWLTGDYQRIQNPAYNASRGPVNVFAARFHAEF